MIRVTCLFFAESRIVTGLSEQIFEFTEGSIHLSQLIEQILKQYPALEKLLKRALWAINEEYTSTLEDPILTDKDQVALIPPLSGG
jgi:molybdopterin converting factor small subunit